MNYDEIEELVKLAKTGDINARETLAKEFTPFILNLSKRSFINSFEFEDTVNECYKTLFKCVVLYNPDRHRFVSYATNAIKNSINYLIRISFRRNGSEGFRAFILDGNLENILYTDIEYINDNIYSEYYKSKLRSAINSLADDEQKLLTYIFYKGYSLKKYSELAEITYSAAVYKKRISLKKLKIAINYC